MDEKRIIELLTRKLAGEASKGELIELNDLIAKYPDTQHTGEVLTRIWNSKVDEEDINFFYERHKIKYPFEFEASPNDEPSKELPVPKANRAKYVMIGVAVIFFLVLAGSLFFYQSRQTSRAPAYTQIISGKGIRKSVTLPDGTNVFLNADSRLSYDAHMNTNSIRVVELAGEAFFDVVHKQGRPFIIHTNKVSIKVLGTAFNVKAYPDDKKCETTLIRGIIELSTNDGTRQKFILKPSEKFSVIEGRAKESAGKKNIRNDSSTLLIENIAPVKLANKEYVPETSWTENKLIFENETLEDLAPELERWFNVKISITGHSPANDRFTGAFANETIEQALMAMKLIKPFNFTIHEKNITIY